ncbi:MAG: hypothetical protein JJ975_04385 [Bacteroidia bacterium]|nr:hypothetical protein [Bacteroidia bacterium]
MRNYLAIALMFCLFQSAEANKDKDTTYVDSIRNIEYQLEGLSHNIINGADVNERITSCYYFVQTLKKALQVPTSFDYEFTLLKTVSILKPADEAFRLFTWNLLLDSGKYMYFGAIQMNTPDTLILYGLYDSADYIREPEFETVDNKHWVGALYYQIHDYKFKGRSHYLLFGWDGEDNLVNRKVIDVLYFDENQKPHFGLPIFEDDEDEYKSRLILTFANQASIICRYDADENLIVFDHLAEYPLHNGTLGYIPDGTYDYMEFIKGFWQRKELLFDDMSDHQHDLRKQNDIQDPEEPNVRRPKKRKNKKAFK